MRRIPVHNPEWTDFNQSDPAITLVELFAFLVDTLLWLTDERQQQCHRRRARRLAFLVVGAAVLAWLSGGRLRTPAYCCQTAIRDQDNP